MTRTRLIVLLLVLLGLAAFQACGSDKSTTPTNPFAGTWDVVFAGSYTGVGTIRIGSGGNFSAPVTLLDNTGTYVETVMGTVATTGQLQNGRIMEGSSQIGTFTGNFSGSQGSGNYQTTPPTQGTWAATKQ